MYIDSSFNENHQNCVICLYLVKFIVLLKNTVIPSDMVKTKLKICVYFPDAVTGGHRGKGRCGQAVQ